MRDGSLIVDLRVRLEVTLLLSAEDAEAWAEDQEATDTFGSHVAASLAGFLENEINNNNDVPGSATVDGYTVPPEGEVGPWQRSCEDCGAEPGRPCVSPAGEAYPPRVTHWTRRSGRSRG